MISVFIEVGDTWSLQLQLQRDRKPPFTYTVSSSGSSAPVIDQDSGYQDYATFNGHHLMAGVYNRDYCQRFL